jgi:hypothetical protein
MLQGMVCCQAGLLPRPLLPAAQSGAAGHLDPCCCCWVQPTLSARSHAEAHPGRVAQGKLSMLLLLLQPAECFLLPSRPPAALLMPPSVGLVQTERALRGLQLLLMLPAGLHGTQKHHLVVTQRPAAALAAELVQQMLQAAARKLQAPCSCPQLSQHRCHHHYSLQQQLPDMPVVLRRHLQRQGLRPWLREDRAHHADLRVLLPQAPGCRQRGLLPGLQTQRPAACRAHQDSVAQGGAVRTPAAATC